MSVYFEPSLLIQFTHIHASDSVVSTAGLDFGLIGQTIKENLIFVLVADTLAAPSVVDPQQPPSIEQLKTFGCELLMGSYDNRVRFEFAASESSSIYKEAMSSSFPATTDSLAQALEANDPFRSSPSPSCRHLLPTSHITSMARKGSFVAVVSDVDAVIRNKGADNSQTKPEQSKTLHPTDATVTKKKLATLKMLNDILLKQTVELREKENHVANASRLSAFESVIAFLVLSTCLADEQDRLKQQDAMEEQLKIVADEKEEIEKALDLAVSDRDTKDKEVDIMRAADGEKISCLAEQLQSFCLDRGRLEAELMDSKNAWKSLEEDHVVSLDKLKNVRVNLDLLKKEKGAAEQSFILKMKDWAGDINKLERERAEQNAVIASQAEDLLNIESTRDQLERLKILAKNYLIPVD